MIATSSQCRRSEAPALSIPCRRRTITSLNRAEARIDGLDRLFDLVHERAGALGRQLFQAVPRRMASHDSSSNHIDTATGRASSTSSYGRSQAALSLSTQATGTDRVPWTTEPAGGGYSSYGISARHLGQRRLDRSKGELR